MVVFSYLLYYLVLIPVSSLPFSVLYLLSDFLFFILFRVLGYRKEVVMQNIRNSFPEKTNAEHREIAYGFYSHLCDLIVESIKIFTISEKEVMARMTCRNAEVVNKYYDAGKSIILAGGHFNNWELFAVAVHRYIKHRSVGIYQPLNNKFFDNKMQETRSKFGLELLSTKKVKSFFISEKDSLTATFFGIDQSPGSSKSAYWMTFLNQDTAVAFGAEKFAVEFGYPVIFGRINKIKRGYYELEFEEISSSPSITEYGYITETSTRILERDILRSPQYWLWSHRRWKKKREPREKIAG